MKGMKRTNREFQKNNVYEVMNEGYVMSNMCMAPDIVVRESRKRQRKFRTQRVRAKEIVAILMMVFGIGAIIFSLVEAYVMTYPEFYSQYVFISRDGVFAVLISGFVFFKCGIMLAWNS